MTSKYSRERRRLDDLREIGAAVTRDLGRVAGRVERQRRHHRNAGRHRALVDVEQARMVRVARWRAAAAAQRVEARRHALGISRRNPRRP